MYGSSRPFSKCTRTSFRVARPPSAPRSVERTSCHIPLGAGGDLPYTSRSNSANSSGRRTRLHSSAVRTRCPSARTSGSGSVYGATLLSS